MICCRAGSAWQTRGPSLDHHHLRSTIGRVGTSSEHNRDPISSLPGEADVWIARGGLVTNPSVQLAPFLFLLLESPSTHREAGWAKIECPPNCTQRTSRNPHLPLVCSRPLHERSLACKHVITKISRRGRNFTTYIIIVDSYQFNSRASSLQRASLTQQLSLTQNCLSLSFSLINT